MTADERWLRNLDRSLDGTPAEHIYFDTPAATVTSSRLVLPGETYSISNITSVKNAELRPSLFGPAILCLAAVVLGAVLGYEIGGESAGALAGIFFAALAVTVAMIIWRLARSDRFAVMLGTAGGEVRALVTEDQALVQEISDALNQAIADRG